MQQLVHNNSGASMGTLETALSEHKDAEDKAMSKHEQMRLRAEVKKLARQEKWKQKAAKEDADRWGSVGLQRMAVTDESKQEEMKRRKAQDSWRSEHNFTPTTAPAHPKKLQDSEAPLSPGTAEVDKMFTADKIDASFGALEAPVAKLLFEPEAASEEKVVSAPNSATKVCVRLSYTRFVVQRHDNMLVLSVSLWTFH
jgi:hypothetical protein